MAHNRSRGEADRPSRHCDQSRHPARVGAASRRVVPGPARRLPSVESVPPRSPYDNLVHPRTVKKPTPTVEAEKDLVVEDPSSGLRRRRRPLREGRRPPRGPLRQGARLSARAPASGSTGGPSSSSGPSRRRPPAPPRSASGSTYVAGARARVAREGRIYVEGKHDAELVEKVWGHDLRIEGVVVEPLHGVDDLPAIVRDFRPAPGRRLGVLVDHLVKGSKESRIADQITGEHALVVGHPFIDIWQAVKPSVVGIKAWPAVPKGEDWKTGVCTRLGWEDDTGYVWAQRILARVRTWTDLEPRADRPRRGADRLRHHRLSGVVPVRFPAPDPLHPTSRDAARPWAAGSRTTSPVTATASSGTATATHRSSSHGITIDRMRAVAVVVAGQRLGHRDAGRQSRQHAQHRAQAADHCGRAHRHEPAGARRRPDGGQRRRGPVARRRPPAR